MMHALSTLQGWLWGWPTLVVLLGVGLYLSLGLRLLPLRRLPEALGLLWRGRRMAPDAQGIAPFSTLMTALASTVGTGNIVGVATAITLGGPGALFWMWVTAIVGMATKYAEAVLAVRFRVIDEQGQPRGGPMYYILHGLGEHWRPLALTFAAFTVIAAFGIGNTIQSHSVADSLEEGLGLPRMITAVVLMVLVFAVIVGGLRRIAAVATRLVPLMGLLYFCAGLWVLGYYMDAVPAAISLVFQSAFQGHAAAGGFAGATVMAAIQFGVARGMFSNESGMGSTPIAHASSSESDPVRQGLIAMLGNVIDTLVLCSITGLAIISSGAWQSGGDGVALTMQAFGAALPLGELLVMASLALFAFSTILGWSVYAERCGHYLFGPRFAVPFRWLWSVAVPCGTLFQLELVWALGDIFNALMALPNLLALLLLSPVVFRLSMVRLSSLGESPRQA